jgi:hypothetical protein
MRRPGPYYSLTQILIAGERSQERTFGSFGVAGVPMVRVPAAAAHFMTRRRRTPPPFGFMTDTNVGMNLDHRAVIGFIEPIEAQGR